MCWIISHRLSNKYFHIATIFTAIFFLTHLTLEKWKLCLRAINKHRMCGCLVFGDLHRFADFWFTDFILCILKKIIGSYYPMSNWLIFSGIHSDFHIKTMDMVPSSSSLLCEQWTKRKLFDKKLFVFRKYNAM